MQQQAIPSGAGGIRTSGWIQFAGIMILITGGLNAIDGIVAFYRTSYFRDTFVFGNLRMWSIVFMGLAVLQIAAGIAILGAQGWGRWFGIAMVSINAFAQLFFISSYPVWSAVIIAYDIAIFYALSVHWQRRSVAAS